MRHLLLVLITGLLAAVVLSAPMRVKAQPMTADQLDQLVAPVALYPDDLLMQVLMASTYPLEVVEAERWLHGHQGMSEAERKGALSAQTWDASVTSLTAFPDVLYMMSQNLMWTEALGEAFLAQQSQLMDAVQTMRRRAASQDKLHNCSQIRVGEEDGAITIEPTNPDIVFVPMYDPSLVYGMYWGPPAWYYPGVMVAPYGWVPYDTIGFGVGVFVGGWMFGVCDWHQHHVWVNGNYWTCPFYRGGWNYHQAYGSNVFTQNGHFYYRAGAGPPTALNAGQRVPWVHDSVHRAGVNYVNPALQQRYQRNVWDVPRNELRGYPSVPQRPAGVPGLSQPAHGVPYPYSIPRSSAPTMSPPSGAPLPSGGYDHGQYDIRAGQRGASSSGRPGGEFHIGPSAPSRPVFHSTFSAPRGGGGRR